jgi:hypothetical protein
MWQEFRRERRVLAKNGEQEFYRLLHCGRAVGAVAKSSKRQAQFRGRMRVQGMMGELVEQDADASQLDRFTHGLQGSICEMKHHICAKIAAAGRGNRCLQVRSCQNGVHRSQHSHALQVLQAGERRHASAASIFQSLSTITHYHDRSE